MASPGVWEDVVEITFDKLSLDKYATAVHDAAAGGIATFTGVTRDTFDGKTVVRLEYEAYIPMATSKLRELCQSVRAKWSVSKMAIAHRLGVVDVGEASVIIAVSSVHRKEALEACHFAIDELKATVPIWKKEVYEGGEVWKQNSEYAHAPAIV